MPLTKSDVEHIATLARLALDPKEVDAYAGQLSRIVDFVTQLEQADTGGVEPMAHPLDTVQRLRADDVSEHDRREYYQQNAPAVEVGLYLVPKVIE